MLAREFRWAVDWTEEMGRFSFITMVFIAAAYGTLTRSHLRVSVFSDLMAKYTGARVIDLIHSVILFLFAVVMTVFSWFNFTDGLRYPNISPAIGLNQGYLFIAMCAGFLIISLLHLRDLVQLIRGRDLND